MQFASRGLARDTVTVSIDEIVILSPSVSAMIRFFKLFS